MKPTDRPGWRARAAHALPILLSLLPFGPSWWFVLSKPWMPFSVNDDNALIELAVRQACHGERLLGAGSRFGWNHPGPLQFYLIAPFYLLTGGSNSSVWVAALVLHTFFAAATVYVAQRLGGLHQGLIASAALSLLVAHMGPGFLGHAWGPHAVILPLALFEFLALGLMLSGAAWLPALAFVGSYLVQTHVGLAPIVVSLAAVSAMVALRRPQRQDLRAGPLVITTVVILGAWAPPLLEEFRSAPGNLTALVDFFRKGDASHTFAEVIGPLAHEVGSLPIALAKAIVPSTSDDRNTGAGAAALLLVGCVPLAIASARRVGNDYAARLGLVALVAAATAYLSALRIVGPIVDYLLLFTAAVGFAAWAALAARWLSRRSVPGVSAVVVVLAMASNARGLRAQQPIPIQTLTQMRDVTEVLQRRLATAGVRRPLVRIVPGGWGWVTAAGVLLELERTGLRFAVEESWKGMYRGCARNGEEDAVILFADPAVDAPNTTGFALVGSDVHANIFLASGRP